MRTCERFTLTSFKKDDHGKVGDKNRRARGFGTPIYRSNKSVVRREKWLTETQEDETHQRNRLWRSKVEREAILQTIIEQTVERSTRFGLNDEGADRRSHECHQEDHADFSVAVPECPGPEHNDDCIM